MLTLADIRLRARRKLDDLVKPYLWSDEELLDHINDTLWDASLRANLTIQDDYAITFTQSGTVWNSKYALPTGVLDVKSVYLNSRPHITLERTSIRRKESYFGGRPAQNGKPWAYALDQTTVGSGIDYGVLVRSITFIGTPTEADTAYLDIARLPTRLEYDSDIPEIDPMWQSDLIFGVTALAYLKQDVETYDPKRSERDFAFFTQRFGERLPANVLRERQVEVPYEMIVY